MAAPILTLTLNPALDISTGVAQVVPGEKLRCAAPVVNPGGGGLNVARALRKMGHSSLALVALGGLTGDRLARLLTDEGVSFLALRGPGETRQSLTVTEGASGLQYRFLLPGPEWSPEDQRRACAAVTAAARTGGIFVISGSQPPGTPPDFPAALAGAAAQMGVVLDTSGPALRQAVDRPIPGLAVLRMDSAEAEMLAGRTLLRPRDTADFASSLVDRGVAARVIIARGAEGNVLADAEGRLMARPPHVPVISAVGAGDSFVAGLVLAMAQGKDRSAALTLGSAAAAAAVMTPATDLCRAEDLAGLLPQVDVLSL